MMIDEECLFSSITQDGEAISTDASLITTRVWSIFEEDCLFWAAAE
jgi:hypothetical protein